VLSPDGERPNRCSAASLEIMEEGAMAIGVLGRLAGGDPSHVEPPPEIERDPPGARAGCWTVRGRCYRLWRGTGLPAEHDWPIAAYIGQQS